MITHPFESQSLPIPGTRLLTETFGLVGQEIQYPRSRDWQIVGFFAPTSSVGVLCGVRARLLDLKGFYTFINQRDLELLLDPDLGGRWCPWLGEDYPDIDSSEWYGPAMDGTDLEDDLLVMEWELRDTHGSPLPSMNAVRKVYDGYSNWEREEVLLYDMDLETGESPDTRLATIGQRWVLAEKRKVVWNHV